MNETRERLSDEVVNRALVIASRGKPVGAGDGDTYVMHVPTLQTMRAALEFALRAAESPSLSVAEAVEAEREACAKVADEFTNAGPDDISEEPMVGRFQREIGKAIRARSVKEG